MTKHIHAELMAQYAEDAMTTDEPWALWEWRGLGMPDWAEVTGPRGPSWMGDHAYRRKPAKTRVVNGFTVPDPLMEAPEVGTKYFLADQLKASWGRDFTWTAVSVELTWLGRGLIFTTEEAAVANAKAMCGVDPEWRQA